MHLDGFLQVLYVSFCKVPRVSLPATQSRQLTDKIIKRLQLLTAEYLNGITHRKKLDENTRQDINKENPSKGQDSMYKLGIN